MPIADNFAHPVIYVHSFFPLLALYFFLLIVFSLSFVILSFFCVFFLPFDCSFLLLVVFSSTHFTIEFSQYNLLWDFCLLIAIFSYDSNFDYFVCNFFIPFHDAFLLSVIRGKRIVLVDDSIVRGNTIMPIIQMLRKHGAKEVP